MIEQHDFLVEIGTEELPPKALKRLATCFAEALQAGIEQAGLNFSDIKVFATPRRLAVLVTQLDAQQAQTTIERRGPAYQTAFNDQGEPTPACLGFAKSCGVSVDELQVIETEKGKWLGFNQLKPGLATVELMPDLTRQALAKLPIPKPMRWGNGDTEFVRPVHWVVMLYGEAVINEEILGKVAGRVSYGHRFHSPNAIEIDRPDNYEALLAAANVMVDFEQRQQSISEQLQQLTADMDAQAVVDQALLDEVTALVEWPVALLINFDEHFLKVPAEALMAAMRDHQKCFPIKNKQQKLLACFITISNIESQTVERVITGNQRVMRARLSDAAFFYETDCQHSLASRLERTEHVVFQAKLGSLADKTRRLSQLAENIAELLKLDSQAAARAGLLAKCDLVTDMVGEFPELQGTMAYYYAQHDGEDEAVALALKEQYSPRFSGDNLSSSDLGDVLALAERLDNLVGIFGIGQKPTGVKDPFALRRAALGVVRILIEKKLDLDIEQLLTLAQKAYQSPLPNKEVMSEVKAYLLERLRAWYQEQGIATNVISAVLARQSNNLNDFHQRLQAVIAFSQLAEAQALAAANKRVSRILKKEGYDTLSNGVDNQLLQDDAERELASLIETKKQAVTPLYEEAKYTEALSQLANLRQPVDRFFDEVMVMVEDESLRHNRLALLARLRRLFLQIADISLLQA